MKACSPVLILLLLASCQIPGNDSSRKEASIVELRAMTRIELKQGIKQVLPLVFDIEPGYHIMADNGTNDQWVYTQMTLEAQQGFLTDAPLFPVPSDLYLTDDAEPLYVFEKKLEIRVPILPAVQSEGRSYLLSGQLRYQACTSKKCLFPRTLEVKIPVAVVLRH